VIIYIIGVLLVLRYVFNESIGNLVTSLSIVGAAIALSTRESLENIIASFIIFFDKPFKTGDDLTIQSITGNVERIGLRSTKIRTADKTLVSVPNKQMVDSIVDNLSMRTERRDAIIIELSQKTNSSDVKKAIETIKSNLQQHNPALISYAVYLTEITKTGLQIHIEYLTPITPVVQIESLKQNIQLQIKEILEELKIELSFEAD
jgi:MscS family membrane protein